MDKEASIAHRDRFRKVYIDEYNSRDPQKPLMMNESWFVPPFWDDVAKYFHQLRYRCELRSNYPCSAYRAAPQQARWVKDWSFDCQPMTREVRQFRLSFRVAFLIQDAVACVSNNAGSKPMLSQATFPLDSFFRRTLLNLCQLIILMTSPSNVTALRKGRR
jgi:hypothetical protein